MIVIRDLWKTYGSGAAQVHALRGVDLDVDAGEFVAIVGPSGSGKSTLLNLIGALDTPTRGSIEVSGQKLHEMDDAARTEFRRTTLGFAFQFFNLLPMLSAMENIALPLLLAGASRPDADARATELLERVGLAPRKYHRPDEMSGGEMQRVAVARALASDPRVILADEPTGNLDSSSGAGVLALLQEVVAEEQRCLLMVTHDPRAAEYADRTVRLADGQVTSDGLADAAARAGRSSA